MDQNNSTLQNPVSHVHSEQQFREVMINAGLTPPDYIKVGEIHRFPGVGKKKGNTAGWCRLFEDCRGGSFGDWSTDLNQSWQINDGINLTQQEKADFKRCIEETREANQITKVKQQDEAAKKAQNIWNNSPHATEHAYLKRKQVKPYGVKVSRGNLVIPIYINDTMTSIQYIEPNGSKRFLGGGKIKGGIFYIGDEKLTETICIGTGFATCASIHEATGFLTVVTFNDGNLQTGAQAVAKQYPNSILVICSDDDWKKNTNTAITKARAAAKLVGGVVALPTFDSHRPDWATDFNDLHLLEGGTEVKRQINAANGELCQSTNNELTQVRPIYNNGQRSTEFHIDKYVFAEKPDRCLNLNSMEMISKASFLDIHHQKNRKKGESRSKVGHYLVNGELGRIYDVGYRPFRRQKDQSENFNQFYIEEKQMYANLYVPPTLLPNIGECNGLLDYMRYLFASEEQMNIVLNWLAYIVQFPEKRINWMMTLVGEKQGTGKSKFVTDIVIPLIGNRNFRTLTEALAVTQFNGWVETSLIFMPEIDSPSKQLMIALKQIITEDYLPLNEKNLPLRNIRNTATLIACSNTNIPFPISETDHRRHVFIKCVNYKKSKDYYRKLYSEDIPAELSPFLCMLLDRQVPSHFAHDTPSTELKEQAISDHFVEYLPEIMLILETDGANPYSPDEKEITTLPSQFTHADSGFFYQDEAWQALVTYCQCNDKKSRITDQTAQQSIKHLLEKAGCKRVCTNESKGRFRVKIGNRWMNKTVWLYPNKHLSEADIKAKIARKTIKVA